MNNINVKQFFYYDELSDEAKVQARINILVPEYDAKQKALADVAKAWGVNKHKVINDPYHIKRLINVTAILQKVKKQGDKYLLAYIRDNLSIFTDKGEYVYYVGRLSIVSNGITYIITDPVITKPAIQAYIDVNERGPAYHDALYRSWERVKRNMIVNNKG